MESVCRIAVVIPAMTCPYHQVERVLSQLTPEDRLIVVFNGMTETTDKPQKKITDRHVNYLNFQSPLGAGRARNIGVKALNETPEAILFFDADDQINDMCLEELAKPLLDASADLVGGALVVREHSGCQKKFLPTVDYWYKQALFGGNMGITYEAWCRLGGFDESLICCEDTDIAWRADNLGLRIKVQPNSTINVKLKSSNQEFRQRLNWGKSSIKLLRKHSIGFSHLPRLITLIRDKKATGFARNPVIASMSQLIGQYMGKGPGRP